MKPGTPFFKNSHLLISALFILIIAVTYGVSPEKIVPALALVKTGRTDIGNAFKSIMGLYLGMAAFWVWGIIRPQFWYAATLTTIFFALGLVLGRLLSLLSDGFPSREMMVALGIELLLGLWGILSLRTYAKSVRTGITSPKAT